MFRVKFHYGFVLKSDDILRFEYCASPPWNQHALYIALLYR